MSRQNELNYQIVMKRKIIGSGKIEDIKKKYLNKKFELLSDKDESFEVDLKFTSPSIVTKIQLKLIKTYRFSLRLMNSQNQLVEQFIEEVSDKDGRVTLFPLKAQPITLVKLKIENNPFNMERIGINYVCFEGFSDSIMQKKKKSNIKDNNGSNLKIEDMKIQSNLKTDPKNINSKDLFNGRSKQKSVKDDVERLLGLTQYGRESFSKQQQRAQLQRIQQKLKKKVKHNESLEKSNKKSIKKQVDLKLREKQETDLAIALSKSQHHQMEIESDYQKMEVEELRQEQKSLPLQLENYVDNILLLPDRRYQTVEFNEQYISMFSDLNPKWLEAQRLAQIQAQVREQERLSNYIKIKHLIDIEVYISDFPEWKIEELKHQAKILGCRIISQLKNHCLAIVPKSVCQKLLKKYKAWNEIKYISPQYLQDCIKQQSKLSLKDYYLRV